MTVLLAIDPGTTQSGWVEYDAERMAVLDSGVMDNEEMVRSLESPSRVNDVAIEMIASYGMAVGREVFETCVWIGRFVQAYHDPDAVRLVYRRDVKLHMCGTPRAKDANIRQALIDLFGGKEKAVGRKANPGPLYGVKSHAWPALGVAVTAAQQIKEAA
ncbi:hypothetical protein [Paraburkholderia atlantica]|uniref:hypothetical protein n=1 Tax=Paraburkholderia atlantica TaxID=2654982 RepID=UPI0016220507|nr:hypothetical protein [Paraburkholderia atlantica]MBB5414084.1 hypothetical protein [Paraburkholderia atlantica]